MTRSSKLAMLAGYVDGDGSISISIITRKDWNGYSFQPYISIGLTSRKVCKWAQHHFGGNLYGYEKDGRQKIYHWKLYGREPLRSLLTDLLPYLFTKRDVALVVLEYIALGNQPNQAARLEIARRAQAENKSNHLATADRALSERETFAYLATLLDAEGAFCIRDNRGQAYSAFVKISLTNEPLIDWVNSLFPGSKRKTVYTSRSGRDLYSLSVYGKEKIERLLLAILPYLIEKREVVNTVLQFVRLGNGWNKAARKELFERLRDIQVRSKTPTTNTAGCPTVGHKIESELVGDYENATAVMQES